MKDTNLIMVNLNGGDYAFYFVTQELFDEASWPDGMEPKDYMVHASSVLGKAVEEKDPRIIKTIYCQDFCQDGVLNFATNIKNILALRAL
jgi:hypothetical protein